MGNRLLLLLLLITILMMYTHIPDLIQNSNATNMQKYEERRKSYVLISINFNFNQIEANEMNRRFILFPSIVKWRPKLNHYECIINRTEQCYTYKHFTYNNLCCLQIFWWINVAPCAFGCMILPVRDAFWRCKQ